MPGERGKSRRGKTREFAPLLIGVVELALVGSCRRPPAHSDSGAGVMLRVGVGTQAQAANPTQGLRQVNQILVVEGLARTGEDGRMQPALAESWSLGNDGRTIAVKLRHNVKFHDGSPVDGASVADILPAAMRTLTGSMFSDVTYRAVAADSVEISFAERSPFLVETLEATIQKPSGAATGPFVAQPKSPTEFAANQDYYFGRPVVAGVHVESFPSARTAWAEMLRDRTDMLWEVGPDALPSLEKASSISVYTFTRRYQYLMVLNPNAPALKSVAIRRALNLAMNRDAVVRNALNSYGVPSTGPVWPRNWAMPTAAVRFNFDPAAAASVLSRSHLKFSCLVPPDTPYERLALEIKRQLAAVGVEMIPEEVSLDEQARRGANRDYDAILTELISGPTLLRPYVIWHSHTPYNWGQFGNETIDKALDRMRHASSDDDLRTAIGGVQQAFVDDPPAIFLAWSVRARAVSKRFAVQTEEGRDILATMRLWRPTTADPQASRN